MSQTFLKGNLKLKNVILFQRFMWHIYRFIGPLPITQYCLISEKFNVKGFFCLITN